MASPQQMQWQDVQQILDASGQPVQPVPFAAYYVNVGPVQGGVLNFAPSGQRAADRIRPRHDPPGVLPRQVPGFLDRKQEQSQLGQALARFQVADVHGLDGTGKTALISQVMHGLLLNRYKDGVVYLGAAGEVYDDLLQDLLKQFFDVGKEPVRFTENEVRGHMAGKQALIAVDDSDTLSEKDVEALMQVVPGCALVVAGREQRVWQGTGVLLQGLPHDQAVALFERIWGQPTEGDRPAVEAICQALEDVPKAIIKTASMAAQRKVPLDQVLHEVQSRPEQQDPVGQAAWMLGFHLSDGERQTLAGLAAPGGPTVDLEALAYITQIPADKLTQYLARLQKLLLVSATDGRFGLDEALQPHVLAFGVDEAMRARAAHYYLRRAGALRPRSKDPDEVNVVAAMDYYFQRGQWSQVTQIAREMDRYLATAGRWGSWRQQLERALHAARQIGDRPTEAWAQNQLGVVAVGAGSVAAAQELFRGALAIWQSLGDRAGVTIARWNLHVLLGPPPPPGRPRPRGEPGGGASALPIALGITAAVLALALVGLVAVALWRDQATPTPLPPAATTPIPPRVDLGLAAGCGQIFGPGESLDIQVWSSVAGRVDVSWVDPSGNRQSLFSTQVGAGETARQPWDAPERDGSWTLEGTLNDGQASDRCAFIVQAPTRPSIRIWLARGCDATYDPGTALDIRLESSVDGRAAVWLVSPGGQRSHLYDESLQAGRQAGKPWEAPGGQGMWVLEAELDGGEAHSQCAFSVAPESQPPVIEVVWIEPLQDGPVCPGDQVMVYAQVFDESGLERVELVTRRPQESEARVPMEAIDDRTYRYPLISYEEPGTTYYVYAQDVHGNAAESPPETHAVPPCISILYDFIEMAPRARWTSFYDGYPFDLGFPGDEYTSDGSATWGYGVTMEDGSRPDHRVLQMRLPYGGGDWIRGEYEASAPVDVLVQAGDRFVARVGFLYGSPGADVTFRLEWWNGDPDGSVVTLTSVYDSSDGVVQDLVIPLDGLAGQAGYFTLAVEGGEFGPEDPVVWVEARIERP